jgi:glycosyltransferase involved in cell wall biosynthesis
MIVKNETKVLPRLFASVTPYIDYYVIVDTGSSDGTPEFIKSTMDSQGIRGEVHSRPWVNFGVNRQQALELAVAADQGEWLLFIDADEELVVTDPNFFTHLDSGVTYDLEKHHSGQRYAVPHLLNVRHATWCWEGPVHNYLKHLSGDSRRAVRKDVWIKYYPGEGAKSQGVTQEQKYLRDAALLEDYLKSHPDDPRSCFYLAQSYRDAGHRQKAYEVYCQRAKLGGWAEETFMAQLEAGRAARALDFPEEIVLKELLKAHELRPSRAEPLFELAGYFRLKKQYARAYLFAKAGSQIPRPDDRLFIAQEVYAWRLLDELSVSAYWSGHYTESQMAAESLLACAENGVRIPESDLRRIRENATLAKRKVDSLHANCRAEGSSPAIGRPTKISLGSGA